MNSFEGIKEGDKVVLGQRYTIYTVVSVTKTQATARSEQGNKIRFSKRDGSLIGNKHTYVVPLTANIETEMQEYKLEVQRKRMIKKIQDALPRLSGAKLQEILNMLQ